MTSEPVILVVDDSPSAALFMSTVFKRAGFERPPQFATDGDDAIAYLQGEGRYCNREEYPVPMVVLLDLNMPRKNGFEILAWIRRQPIFGRIHVYILSASNRREDIDKAYDLGANAYLVKPGNLDDLLHMAKSLAAWLKLGYFATGADPDEGRRTADAVGAGLAVHHWAH